MGTLSTEAQKVVWNVNSVIKNIGDGAEDIFNSIIGRVGSAAGGILNGDVVGINEAQIPAMQEAIRNYVNAIQSHLQTVNTSVDTNNAFKGEYAAAIKNFVQAVCTACECVTSNLLQFNKKLDEVYAKYLEKDTTMASEITAQAGEIESSFTRYTE